MDEPQITNEWIDQQLAICDAATKGPWMWGRFAICEENIAFLNAALNGCPAVLRALKEVMARNADEDEYSKGGFMTPEDPRLVGEIPEEFCVKIREI